MNVTIVRAGRRPAPIWLARTRLEWSRLRLARGRPGDSDAAGEMAEQAYTTAVDLGLPALERQAAELRTGP